MSLVDWSEAALKLCQWIDDNVYSQSDQGPTNITEAVDRMQSLSKRPWCPEEFRTRARKLSSIRDVWDDEMRRTYRILCDLAQYTAEDRNLLPRGEKTLERVV